MRYWALAMFVAGCGRGVEASRHVDVETFCVFSDTTIGFVGVFSVDYKKTESMDAGQRRVLYSVACDVAGKSCSASRLSLDNIESGKRLSLFDLGGIDASLVGIDGDMAVIKWGDYRRFNIRRNGREVFFSENSHNSDGFGKMNCPP